MSSNTNVFDFVAQSIGMIFLQYIFYFKVEVVQTLGQNKINNPQISSFKVHFRSKTHQKVFAGIR